MREAGRYPLQLFVPISLVMIVILTGVAASGGKAAGRPAGISESMPTPDQCRRELAQETREVTGRRIAATAESLQMVYPEKSRTELEEMAWRLRDQRCDPRPDHGPVSQAIRQRPIDLSAQAIQARDDFTQALPDILDRARAQGMDVLTEQKIRAEWELGKIALTNYAEQVEGQKRWMEDEVLHIGEHSIGHSSYLGTTCGDNPDLCGSLEFIDDDDFWGAWSVYFDEGQSGDPGDPVNLLFWADHGTQPPTHSIMEWVGWETACGSDKWNTLEDGQHGGEDVRTTQWDNFQPIDHTCVGTRMHMRDWVSITGDTHSDAGYASAAAHHEVACGWFWLNHCVDSFDDGRDRVRDDVANSGLYWYLHYHLVYHGNTHPTDGDGFEVLLHLDFVPEV